MLYLLLKSFLAMSFAHHLPTHQQHLSTTGQHFSINVRNCQCHLTSSFFLLFWHAPLGVHSTKCRHQSPRWTILSHASCFIQGEVTEIQVLLDSLHPHSTRVSWWSPPVLQGRQNVKINKMLTKYTVQ